jgi:hypothetical protein
MGFAFFVFVLSELFLVGSAHGLFPVLFLDEGMEESGK